MLKEKKRYIFGPVNKFCWRCHYNNIHSCILNIDPFELDDLPNICSSDVEEHIIPPKCFKKIKNKYGSEAYVWDKDFERLIDREKFYNKIKWRPEFCMESS